MTNLLDAWEKNFRTNNGMKTNFSSKSPCLDLFFLAGASRGKNLSNLFMQAANENLDIAGRILLWMRDIRGGAGERQQFRDILYHLAENEPNIAKLLLPHVPIVGRWDDLLSIHSTPLLPEIIMLIEHALYKDRNALCAKWLPRKGEIAAKLRRAMGLSPKKYRKLLVALTQVVETQMCSNEWSHIVYPHVPSRAASIYRNAFSRHDGERYTKYVGALKKGETKINASAIFPHDIIKACMTSRSTAMDAAEAQWDALPNYMSKTSERILPVCDVSGSMTGLPIQVCISLGLYISERNQGVFKDIVCTFSNRPGFVKLQAKRLTDRIKELNNINWSMNTNLLLLFDVLLRVATKESVPESQMPSMILIISDMEFDSCVSHDDNAIQGIERRYKENGYKIPKVVFWNVNGRIGNIPVRMHKSGTALVSGFSPSILTSLLSNPKDFTPTNIMLNTVNIDKYRWLK